MNNRLIKSTLRTKEASRKAEDSIKALNDFVNNSLSQITKNMEEMVKARFQDLPKRLINIYLESILSKKKITRRNLNSFLKEINERGIQISFSEISQENRLLLEIDVGGPEIIEQRHYDQRKSSIPASKRQDYYETLVFSISLIFLDFYLVRLPKKNTEVMGINVFATSINPANGNEVRKCISSLATTIDEFAAINIARVDPKACFKGLKGISAGKLASLTAVPPVLTFNTADSRIVDNENVANDIDASTNLASIHWQDFEHLVRELFQAEFGNETTEVKITQASADGGVDAIVFDQDPLRGGKIVIQAKRYTNLVSVSAIRDLYGTVLNEGAIKGILVTTSEYGPDSYKFAQGKPLTLLNGGNLLHLLEKHGTKARIDLGEAKRLYKMGVELPRVKSSRNG